MKKLSVEQIFVSALRSDAKLRWYIYHGINVVEYLDAKWPSYMSFVDITFAFITKRKRAEMFVDFSKERILKTLELERPDLYKTINTEKGLIWLENQIGNFRGRFL